ncbi:MAG: protease complex subunit PrcB family protein [Bacillota bacterium]
MRKWMIGLALSLAVLLVAGCGGAKPGGADPKDGGGGFAYVKTPFEKVEPGQEPPEVARELEQMKEKAGTKTVVLGETTYAIITAGEKSNGGWSVTVESVGDSEGKLEIVYRVQAPAPGSVNTAAITYPSVVIKFKNPADLPITFKEAK